MELRIEIEKKMRRGCAYLSYTPTLIHFWFFFYIRYRTIYNLVVSILYTFDHAYPKKYTTMRKKVKEELFAQINVGVEVDSE